MPDFSALRSVANSFLTDVCTIREPVAAVFDAESGYDDESGSKVYEGVCCFQASGGARTVEAGEALVSLQGNVLYLPFDTSGVKVDQLVTLTDSGSPFMVGRTLRITDVTGREAYVKCAVELTETNA